MSHATATLLVPSLLPDDVDDWVRGFAEALRDEVAAPLFGSVSAEAYEAALADLMARGATLRFRWLNSLVTMSDEERAARTDDWLRPPPPVVLAEIQVRAAALLGREQSFKVRRALSLLFTEGLEVSQQIVARLDALEPTERWLVEMARGHVAAARHDVLAIAWIMVLFGDVAVPSADVAEAAAATLLRYTADRSAVLREIVEGEVRLRDVPLRDDGTPWERLEHHPLLMLPCLTLVGFALDDEQVVAVTLGTGVDPEDTRLQWVELRLVVAGDPDEARWRIEEQALLSGALGAMSDGSGTSLVLTAEAAPAS